jgi:mono/diheme cytochrome c family protein
MDIFDLLSDRAAAGPVNFPRARSFQIENYSPLPPPDKSYEGGNICRLTQVYWMGPVQTIRTRTLVGVVTPVTAGIVTGAPRETVECKSDGRRLFQQCSGWHSAETSERKVGPSLDGLFQKRVLLNGAPANERSYVLESKNGGDGMPPYDRILASKELHGLVAYLKTPEPVAAAYD